MKAGWEKKTLREVLSVLRNGLNCKQDKSGNGVKISRIESIADATFNPERVGYADLSETEKQRFLLKRGDILFSHINSPIHVGKTAIVDCDEQIYHGVNLLLMRPTDSLLPTYLNLALKYLFHTGYWARSCKQSVNQASVNQQDIFRVEICYPSSKEEQQRIVAILDEAFEAIAAARANAEQNRQNARSLFESYLQSVFSQRGDGWAEASLGECFKLKSGDALTSKDMQAGDYPVYGGNGIAGMHNSFNLSGENVIIGRVGALCGNARRVTDDIWLTDNAFKVVDFYYEFDSAFLTYLLNFKNLRGLARQSAQPVISNSSLKDLILNFPSLPEQRYIAIQLDALREEIQCLESLYQRKIEALDELKQSLLQQAFSGQL